nr:hypothetical protein CFP56_00987 [Quercus suber]
MHHVTTTTIASLLATAVIAQSSSSCSSTLTASYPAPSVAAGYVARLVAQNLSMPRGIKFDASDNLLVVESGKGVTALTFTTADGQCISESSRKTVVSDGTLNHGIEVNGSTLFASSTDAVYSWAYDAGTMSNTSAPTVLVQNMTGEDHTTRTLLASKFAPGSLVVTRGSVSNIDPDADDLASGHSQVKSFQVGSDGVSALDYSNDGVLLGWGLRNDVGVDEDPILGGIWTVENSVDQMTRMGVDIHEDNPAEELNFLGYLNGTSSPNQGRNFGYPECYAAWNASDVPEFNGTTGQQFAIGDQNSTVNDTTCSEANRQAPRLVFQAHMAPLDILFNDAGTAAWITFHGSWDRTDPAGYKLSVVEFANGEPVEASDSTTAARDIVSNVDNSVCPGGCFRPVGLAWDSQGRLFMSSDSTGEIYAILRSDGDQTSSAGSNATGTIPDATTSSSAASSPTGSTGAASTARLSVGALAIALGGLAIVA